MNATRRAFLLGVAVISSIVNLAALRRAAFATWSSEEVNEDTLAAFLDTLIPGDELGPSAVSLKTDKAMLDLESRFRAGFLDYGLEWLEREAQRRSGQPFSVLTESERVAVVQKMEGDRSDLRVQVFFETARIAAFEHYYAQPEAWTALGYHGPPQPHGFLDYAEPPAAKG